MKILIINGANLNLLGHRQPEIYGRESFEDYLGALRARYSGVAIDYYQSNVEGELVDALQGACGKYDGIILNAGGYTHTSVVLRDAVAAICVPVVEVHISSILAREEFRHVSMIAPVACGTIMGFGMESYRLAVEYFMK
ncbi:MAG: type II 3-dehydroquinate dehydratase [Alistipes sp.]|nr:type II 3-dehydroquinate dehydratase [Alistipes sp.]MBQ3248062.1 type II 3-dehydroquinate dehydratase [Alistipes sp.]MBR3826903.1 type II 3-dehydroquinate dehydratase [Alistipes sp.]